MVQRLREAWQTLADVGGMEGPVEVDKTCVGGLEKNRHHSKNGKNPKTSVAGIRDRKTGRVTASHVPETTQVRPERFKEKGSYASTRGRQQVTRAGAGAELAFVNQLGRERGLARSCPV